MFFDLLTCKSIIWCFSEAFPSHAKSRHVSSLPLPNQQGYLEQHIPDSLCSSINPSFISSSGMNQECWTHSVQQSAVLVGHQMQNFIVIIRVVQWTILTTAQIKMNQLFIPLNQKKQNVHASRNDLAWICSTPAVSVFLTKSHFCREILEVKV